MGTYLLGIRGPPRKLPGERRGCLGQGGSSREDESSHILGLLGR